MQLTEERQQHEAAIAEYKQVNMRIKKLYQLLYYVVTIQLFQQLDEGHQKQKEDLNQELLEVKVGSKLWVKYSQVMNIIIIIGKARQQWC